ncbi:hypothetical protein PDESU_01009 [Pontiella desulfatans]|uniref:DUF1254 domain-containing protein n=1 Tax=Pontiella desulfatans TaxID=2750659 RepID=A0A6C2TZ40_PONDE|nr:DUF1254 domain-containing protein [Pontiella desulfatans]VGO12456.1 hypothetical protein PDESU_01009 [Pontiella desulfatans]
MKKLGILTLVSALALVLGGCSKKVHQSAVVKKAVDAYIYAYPLVTFDMVRRHETNTEVPTGSGAPMGQLIKMRKYPAVDDHAAAAPNTDTLYTLAWLDVSEEPMVVGVPDMGDRYYMLPLMDGYSEMIDVIGAGVEGEDQKEYLVVSKGWKGEVPAGMMKIESPTAMIWMCGRIYCTGTPEDYAAAHKLQDQVKLYPLSAYGKPYTPPKGVVDPSLDMKAAVKEQLGELSTSDYFSYFAKLLVKNPPHEADTGMLEKLAEIGIVPGEKFDLSAYSDLDQKLLSEVPKLAKLEMGLHLKKQPTSNGWLYFTEGVGNFGTDYITRGMASFLGPGWNRPHDAIYPLSFNDADGKKYDGAKNNYVLRFEKGELPPVKKVGFWSLTLYDKKMFFVPNSMDRYTLSQRDELIENADGSIEIYIQAESPGKEKEANWLPAPEGQFDLVLRLYGPSQKSPSILDGSWTPPAANKVKK